MVISITLLNTDPKCLADSLKSLLWFGRFAFEEAEHAAKFAELLGEVVAADTKTNLWMRVQAEYGACQGKKDLAVKAKQLGYDAIHDTVHEMCKDEARHGQAFAGLLKRYFEKQEG